jgi:hypothetical protein
MTYNGMPSVRRNLFALPTLLVAIVSLSGCGFLHKHFGRDDSAYRKAAQDRPLEIPPDLDTPSSSGALTIPAAGGTSASTAASPSPSSLAPIAQPPAATIQPGWIMRVRRWVSIAMHRVLTRRGRHSRQHPANRAAATTSGG